MLFLLVLAVSVPFALGAGGEVTRETYYVNTVCSSQSSNCITLEMIATKVLYGIRGDFQLVFLPGIHRLSQTIYVGSRDPYNPVLSLTLTGMGKAKIQCLGNNTSIGLSGISRLEINGLTFSSCGGIDSSVQPPIATAGLRTFFTTMLIISNCTFDVSFVSIDVSNKTLILDSEFKNHVSVVWYGDSFEGRLFVSNCSFKGTLLPKYNLFGFEGLFVQNLLRAVIRDSVFQLHSWSELYKGVPLLILNSTTLIRNVTFWNNVASACGGVLAKNSNITMRSVLFYNNTASNGSICAVQSKISITNTSIIRNRAVHMSGTGGLKAIQSRIWLKNVLFSFNTGYYGGALQMYNSTLFARNAVFKKNTATHYGGAIYSVSSTASFQHSFFSNNSDLLGKTFISVDSRLRKPGGECSDDGSEFKCKMSKAQSVLSGTCNSFTREKLNAGYEPCVYKDSKLIPTIGIGFNLHRSGARQDISAVGANYDELLSGSQCLTDSQIRQLFDRDMATAVSCAQRFVGSNWYRLGETRQSAVADMAFNLGCTKLHGFRRFQAALQSSPPNYRAAMRGMKDSLWCRQVGGRCGRNVACMSSG